MKIEIPELYKLQRSDRERLVLTYLDAFGDYPKLMNAFPAEKQRLLALEATLRYYTAYDLRYGCGFSLNERVHEAVLLVHSDNMRYTFLKHLMAGSYSRSYKTAVRKLSKKERNTRVRLFRELDRLEKTIDIPTPHLYVDFLGVESQFQHKGRGRKLMTAVCGYADKVGLPVMLFTNTADDVRFYMSLGFELLGETSSAEFGFTNTYLICHTNK